MPDDDGQIRIGLGVDVSGLAGAQSVAQESADEIASAYQRVAAAALELQNVQSRHTGILKEYRKGVFDAATAEKLLAQNMAESAAATNLLANAKRGLAAATSEEGVFALNEVAAEDAATEATIRGISARQSAAASIGILEGRTMSGNRAAATFLATTLGLGPALQAAFPVIGALALLDVLGQIIKGIVEFSEKASDLSAELSTDWLTGAVGQLTGLGKAVEQADKQIEKFAADNDAAKSKISSAAVEYARTTQGAVAGDNVRAGQIQQRIDALERAKELATQAAEIYGKNAGSSQFADLHGSVGVADQRKQQEQKIAEYTSDNLEQQSLIAEKENLIVNAQREQLGIAREIVEARIAAAHASDGQLSADAQIAAHLREEQQLHRVAQQYAAPGSAEASPELRTLRDRISLEEAATKAADLAHETGIRAIEAEDKAQREAYTKERRDQTAAAETWRRGHEEQLKGIEEESKASVQSANQQQTAAEKIIAYREKAGLIRAPEAAKERTAVSFATENEQLGSLQKEAGQLQPERGGQDLARYQQVQAQITEVMQKGAQQREQIALQESLRVINAYQHEAQMINQALIGGLNQWMTTSKKFGDAMLDAAKHMAVGFIDQLATIALKWAEKEAMMTVLHLLGITQRKAADATGAATQAATTAAANVASAESYVGVAAAGAAASQAAIPVVGPELAVAAASAMLALGQTWVALAAFERGGIVRGSSGAAVPIMAHANEAVLPAPLTNLLLGAAAGGAGGGAQHKFTSVFSPNITLLDSKGLEGFARRASDVHGREMIKYARRMNLVNG